MAIKLPEKLLHAYLMATTYPMEATLQELWRLLPVVHQEFIHIEKLGLSNSETRLQLIDMWLHASMLVMEYDDAYYTSPSEVDALCRLLNEDHIIQQVVTRELNTRVLALLLSTAVANAEAGGGARLNPGVTRILSCWTGEQLADDEKLTVERVTDLLHGPMVYSLYRPDVLGDTALPPHLCRENIRVVAGEKENQPQAEVALPDNMLPSDSV